MAETTSQNPFDERLTPLEELKAPDRSPQVQFSHFGINVRDFDRMLDFYTRVIGFKVSDQGSRDDEIGLDIAFMSMDPFEHHQFVIAANDALGPNEQSEFFQGPINQLSFRLESLEDLRIMHNRLLKEVEPGSLSVGTHGIAWSVYTRDPEGNTLEFFVDSPWYIDQPFWKAIDLSKSDEEVYADTEAIARNSPGFRPYRDWREAFSKQLGNRPIVSKPFRG